LSIETEVGFLLPGLDVDVNLDRIAHYHGRCVKHGRYGSDDERIHIGLEDRATRSERIRGGTGRRCNDQTVGFVAGHELGIDNNSK